MAEKSKIKPVHDVAVELAPDAWERFEAAVDQVVKPVPKPSGEKRDEGSGEQD